MNPAALFDPLSAAIVVGGTLLATVLRCGPADCRVALAALGQIGARHFDAEGTKAELAVQVQEIQQDGLLRAHPHHFGDREFDEATDALIGRRSVAALLAAHETHKARRGVVSTRAAATWAQAAELAPVFGLAGTLISLSQLPSGGGGGGSYAGAIGMAVQTTLYGLLLANLLLAPLSRVIDRSAAKEERARQRIVDWLAGQVAPAMPHPRRKAQGEAA